MRIRVTQGMAKHNALDKTKQFRLHGKAIWFKNQTRSWSGNQTWTEE